MSKTHHIFISHSWNYGDAYEKLLGLLNQSGLNYKDYSIPQSDPIHTSGSDKELKDAISRKMKPCSCILVLAGVYATYSKWITKEIEIAKSMNKRIIAIELFASDRSSLVAKSNADIVVKWRGDSIKKAIEQ